MLEEPVNERAVQDDPTQKFTWPAGVVRDVVAVPPTGNDDVVSAVVIPGGTVVEAEYDVHVR